MPWWLLVAAGWLALSWFTALFLGKMFAPRAVGQGAPRWAPDPAFDPALREDDEVAALDELWALPTRPGAW